LEVNPVADPPSVNPPKKKPNVRQRQVARTLRSWRKSAKRTLEDVAGQLRWPHNRLSRYETATYHAGPAEIIALATVFGVDEDERDKLVTLAVGALDNAGWWRSYASGTVPDYFADYLETETEASRVRTLETMLVPGLLQTVVYTNRVVDDSTVDETVLDERRQVRQQRQARLDDPRNPLDLHAIVDEPALHRPVAPPRAMVEQLDHILLRAAQSNIVVQVLPAELGTYPGLGSAYHLLSFEDGEAAVYQENLNNGLYVEDTEDVQVYSRHFERLSQMALDPTASGRRITAIRDGWASKDKE
jgi:transcriptional regulator with XRE-family HTH domain